MMRPVGFIAGSRSRALLQEFFPAMLAAKVVRRSVALGCQMGRLVDVHVANRIDGH
jgi:hypothetical protein